MAHGALIAELDDAAAQDEAMAGDPQTEQKAAAAGMLYAKPEPGPAPTGNAHGATFETNAPATPLVGKTRKMCEEIEPAFASENDRKIARRLERGELRHTESRLMRVAEAGIIPPTPDYSAPTHARLRKKLAEVTTLVAAGDIRGLEAIEISTKSSSPRAIDR
ncbi:hypothetical protein C2I36_07970 [Rhodobacteraceae bacterium WD3A24]|nr:hypothetical protein C2I36_07970 [Rhodobacteraceae bacterium WD3A24]